jgi:hypothetical protein
LKAFCELDYYTYSLQRSTGNFIAATHAFALEADELTGGNYGPINPIIRVCYSGLSKSLRQTGENTSILLQGVNGESQRLKTLTTKTSSDQQYLSNISKSVYNILANNQIKIMNNGTRNISLALYLVEADARNWENYGNYWKKLEKKGPDALKNVKTKYDKDSWFELGYLINSDQEFETPGSDYLNRLNTNTESSNQ